MSALRVLLNTAQKRVDKERIQITVAGSDFDAEGWENVWLDPVTDTVMLRPLPLTPEWQTTSSGDYARLLKTAFSLGSTWREFAATAAGATVLTTADMGSSSALSGSTYGQNRGMYISFFPYGTGQAGDNYSFEFGWSNGGNATTGVGLRFNQDGVTEVWKDGARVGTYQIDGLSGNQNTWQTYLLIPMRKRELLVYSITAGTGFVHVFDDILESASTPIITPNEKIWFFVPGNRAVQCEIAPLRFKSSGFVRSKTYSFGRAPLTGQTLGTFSNSAPAASITNARVFADRGSFTSTSEAVSAVAIETVAGSTYTPNGTIDQVRVKVSLTAASGNGYTAFLRGLSTFYAGTFTDTDDADEFDITGSILEASLSVPDDPGGVEFTFSIRDPKDVQTDVPNLLTLENIPAQVWLGDVKIIDGVLNPVESSDEFNPETERGECVIVDGMWALKDYSIRDRIPLDGLLLSHSSSANAVSGLFNMVGVEDADQELDDIAYTLSSTPGEKSGEFSHLIEAGSTPFAEIESLVTELAFGYLWGFKPTDTGIKAFFKDPDGLSATPAMTLYRTQEDAVAASKPATQTYEGFREKPLRIAGNELRVTGIDLRKDEPIIRWKEDTASKAPGTAAGSRPTNWLGFPRVIGFQSPRLTSAAACERLIATAFPKISARNFTGEWDSRLLLDADGVPLWRGDLVALDGEKSLRITSFTARFISEQDDLIFRTAHYTGSSIFTNLGGTSVNDIRMRWDIYWGNQIVVRNEVSRTGSKLPAQSAKVS